MNLPDSRVQIVRYQADHDNGYVADVQYQGEAVFPSDRNRLPGNGNFGRPNFSSFNGGGSNSGGLSSYQSNNSRDHKQ